MKIMKYFLGLGSMIVASGTLDQEWGVRSLWLEEELGLSSIDDTWVHALPCKAPKLPFPLLNSPHFSSSLPSHWDSQPVCIRRLSWNEFMTTLFIWGGKKAIAKTAERKPNCHFQEKPTNICRSIRVGSINLGFIYENTPLTLTLTLRI